MRKRAEAIDELTRIEIKFAKLRDMLYLERLADVEKERIGIETGTHPELIHLTQLIELRRNRKLELARKWFDGLSHAYQVQLDEREHANWHWWEDERARSRMRYFDEANSKRRRLEREKRTLERPKDGADLFSLLDDSFPVHVLIFSVCVSRRDSDCTPCTSTPSGCAPRASTTGWLRRRAPRRTRDRLGSPAVGPSSGFNGAGSRL